ncbi:hypothetical protein OSB04_027288 [Centaurea solstitialis]|uniref:Uncharacterized protein n=1 Tax=Centaurea solstitialis TaxID=347529 RepID=A0AA38VZK6_9ASTR|nr:hypothetical protein OSB04_027288 [Centaurea solstitialis]
MSRQPQLPPRCPISRTSSLNCDPLSSITCKDEKSNLRLQKSVSGSFVLEEQPAWLDDLLGDWDPDACTAATALESACIYGPNSPRSKEKVSIQENPIVSALSEYASHGPVQYVDKDLFVSGFPQLDSVQDTCGSAGEFNIEAKPFKRHNAQRSRVRKLQYIAELERTVENFQNIVSELAVRVDSLVEKRIYLSLENKQLKQQLARLQQEKFVMERQYQCMRNEAEGLKLGGRNGSSKVRTHFRSNSSGDAGKLRVEPSWHMIDMGKLHIN